MFDELWDIIAPFPHFYIGLYMIEVCVPVRYYRQTRDALYTYVARYPGERFLLTLDLL